MNTSTPSKDSDAITRTIASREVNEIRHLLSLNVLLVWTSGAVWKAWAGAQADVMTPANCAVKPQSYEGIADIPPIATESSAVYVTASGKKVRDVAYEFASDSFQGRNVSILAGHLFEGRTIEEWAYAKDPDGIIWCVRSDGVLLGFTYLKEHDVYAWRRHVTDGLVESVACITEGSETILYLAVKRTVGGQTVRYVERMALALLPRRPFVVVRRFRHRLRRLEHRRRPHPDPERGGLECRRHRHRHRRRPHAVHRGLGRHAVHPAQRPEPGHGHGDRLHRFQPCERHPRHGARCLRAGDGDPGLGAGVDHAGRAVAPRGRGPSPSWPTGRCSPRRR